MNDQELDEALAGFRDDVPEMSEGAFLLGKLRLEVATEPAPEPLPAPKPLAVRVEVVDVQRRRSPPSRRQLAPWLITAAAVLAVVAMTLMLHAPDQPTTRTPAAPDELRTVEEPRPLPPPVRINKEFDIAVQEPGSGPGQFLKMTRDEHGLPFSVPGPDGGSGLTLMGAADGIWQEWVPADRSQLWQLTRDADISSPTPALSDDPPLPNLRSGLSKQEGTFQAANGDYFPAKGTWLDPDSKFVAGLPRDPKALYQRLAADSAQESDPQAVAVEFAGWLLSRPVPADLRAALYQALRYHPWLKVDQGARTREGRSAISLSTNNVRTGRSIELLIDPATGLLIGQREIWLVDLTPGQKAGSVVWETSVHWSVVDGLGK